MTGLSRKRLQWENWILPGEAESIFQRIYSFTRTVPEGKVVSYGDVARQCGTIAVLVGKAMAVCPPDVPWHRVVGADGTLRIAKRGPEWALRQRKLLELEGVPFLADAGWICKMPFTILSQKALAQTKRTFRWSWWKKMKRCKQERW